MSFLKIKDPSKLHKLVEYMNISKPRTKFRMIFAQND